MGQTPGRDESPTASIIHSTSLVAPAPPQISLKSFITRNYATLSTISSLTSSLTYLLPSRFVDDDIAPELACAMSDLASLILDSVKHDETGDDRGMTLSLSGSKGSAGLVKACRLLIACVECVEIAVESYHIGSPRQGKVVEGLEGVKMVSRFVILLLSPLGVLRRGGGLVPGETVPSKFEARRRESAYFGQYVRGEVTGRMVRVPGSAVLRGEDGVIDDEVIESSPSSNAMLLAGEVLHVARPWLMKKVEAGTSVRSFAPWAVGLMMDVSSHYLTTFAIDKTRRRDDEGRLMVHPNDETAAELRRRKTRWMLYALRAPVWGNIAGGVEAAVNGGGGPGRMANIPGFRLVVKYILSWLVYIQKHHFLLESSI